MSRPPCGHGTGSQEGSELWAGVGGLESHRGGIRLRISTRHRGVRLHTGSAFSGEELL